MCSVSLGKKTPQRSETSLSYAITPLNENREQYYLLSSESKVTEIPYDEMKSLLEKTSAYGQPAGGGGKSQTGFIEAPSEIFP
ncbi:hypothetical protein K7I13_08225 [Brucepastera parasyntrophica]|uniref:hypothetical protein n=1 Tax=Brucepastera parasyntrophica TaxID=2880008 RepID=UPI00210EFCBA|nr:hypothetical protein [Brucepastera parasyntrophica]ULQ58559.1 hypothetical protein K7I13_08225 [Brucepastera parasyntrophica]